MKPEKVLVTGGTGFLAGWVIRQLIEKGYVVRATVRNLKKGDIVVKMLQDEGVNTDNLSFCAADLSSSDGWDAAMEGIDFVQHIASPLGGNNHEDPTLIPIAKAGVENVLNAAVKAGVAKVVMTSTEGANYPDRKATGTFDESFWTDLNNKSLTNYMRSKVISERTAWDIIGKQQTTQLTTVLPGAILGPFMGGRRSSTDLIFEMLLKGTPSPHVIYPVGDVRDIAALHILAMESEKANGQRFIAEGDEMTMPEMARLLKTELGEKGKKVSTITVPDFLVALGAKFNAPMKVLYTMVGLKYHRTNAKARTLLGWQPRPARQTVLDTANYMIAAGMIK